MRRWRGSIELKIVALQRKQHQRKIKCQAFPNPNTKSVYADWGFATIGSLYFVDAGLFAGAVLRGLKIYWTYATTKPFHHEGTKAQSAQRKQKDFFVYFVSSRLRGKLLTGFA